MTTTTAEFGPTTYVGSAPSYAPSPAPRPATPAPLDRTPAAAGPRIDQLQFWMGAILTSAVTALMGAVAILVAHGIVHVPVALDATAVSPLAYGLVAGFAALAVAGLYNAMLHVAPHPAVYFGWLVTVGTLLAAVLPFTAGMALTSAVAFAAANVLVGLVVVFLVPMAAVVSRS